MIEFFLYVCGTMHLSCLKVYIPFQCFIQKFIFGGRCDDHLGAVVFCRIWFDLLMCIFLHFQPALVKRSFIWRQGSSSFLTLHH
ncbi:hypothetical protein BAE44_0016676 [Dichanthelium oligosanthes]|uniref:Uncharacterized protein n=1 Tax=Dichanthelium oligosanthes TaxID=888268 RepID=A0A1E5VB60_9POAL|nr:hypothetical protein BAE44_0016676 [Dichanthelium oligosanthes]